MEIDLRADFIQSDVYFSANSPEKVVLLNVDAQSSVMGSSAGQKHLEISESGDENISF